VKELLKFAKVIVKIKVARFYGPRCKCTSPIVTAEMVDNLTPLTSPFVVGSVYFPFGSLFFSFQLSR